MISSREIRLYWALRQIRPASTLDAFVADNNLSKIRFVKVDCQGAESLVLSGARGILTERRIEFIAFQYHPTICGAAACMATHQLLKQSGYILTRAQDLHIYHCTGAKGELRPLGEMEVDCDWNG